MTTTLQPGDIAHEIHEGRLRTYVRTVQVLHLDDDGSAWVRTARGVEYRIRVDALEKADTQS